MKAGKKPTRAERELIKSNRLQPANWLIERRLLGEIHIINRVSNKKRIIHT